MAESTRSPTRASFKNTLVPLLAGGGEESSRQVVKVWCNRKQGGWYVKLKLVKRLPLCTVVYTQMKHDTL